MVEKELVLKVEDPDPSHVGRNIVTLDRETKQFLEVTSGDIVEIEGSKKTGAVIWPARAEDEGKTIVRMDSFIRHNAGVGLGERVKVKKAVFKEAKRVVLAPTQDVRIIASGYDRILKKSFLGRPLTRGDSIWISVFGSGFVYRVIDTTPTGIIKVTDFTQFVLKEKPVKGELEGIPRVAYEDIGGLDEQIQKVREMVELPLKHPELFRKLGIVPPKGVLLYGPPGCGKTLLAKAVANETQAHFISVNAPQVMCVGKDTPILTNPKGTQTVGQLFERAEENSRLVNDGRLKILELKKPLATYSLDNSLKIAKGKITHITKLKANALKVRTGLDDEIVVSENQPFAVLDEMGGLVWKTAKEIKKGNLVAVAKNLPDGTANKMYARQLNLNKTLENIPNSDISLIKIISIKKSGEQELFDLTVEPYNNFVGGSSMMLLHNSKFVGEAEERIREIFKEAEENAPSIIFIDEIDAIAPKREEVIGEVERRVVAQILALMDGLEARGNVVVIAATNRVNSLDEALRRPGRFDREIEFGVPDANSRKQILSIHCRGMPIHPPFDRQFIISEVRDSEKDIFSKQQKERILQLLERGISEKELFDSLSEREKSEVRNMLLDKMFKDFASITHGFVGADLSALAKEAAMKALRRYLDMRKIDLEEETIPPEVLEILEVKKIDFESALKDVQPSALREVTIEIPNVRWSQIGGLEKVKDELKQAVEWPLKHPESFRGMGIKPPSGVLLYGPPGCGKTLLAKAVATESEANFISIKGPELLSLFVGESERAVRKVFRKARQVSPVIVFFDEVDSIANRRGSSIDSGVGNRVIDQLLTELDGVEQLKNVVFIAATNRPDILDPSLLRPGRVDKLIYVGAPDEKSRLSVLRVHTRDVPMGKDISLEELAKKTKGFSGADLENLVREAALRVLKNNKMKPYPVSKKDFEETLLSIKPTITEDTEEAYGEFKEHYAEFKPSYVE